MLCTHCSEPIKPIVALDIDGTLSDYHWSFIRFAVKYLNLKTPPNFDTYYDGGSELHAFLGLTKDQYRQVKLAYRQGGQKRLQLCFVGVTEMTQRIRDAGAELWLTTTRPYNRFDSTDPDTLNWLERNDVYWDHLLYDDDKYAQLIELVDKGRVVAILDDLPDQVARARSLGLPAWLLRQPWNEACLPMEHQIRGGLREAEGRILEEVETWQRTKWHPKSS